MLKATDVTPYFVEAATGPWIESHRRAKKLGVALPGSLTTEGSEGKNQVATRHFKSNSMHGGGRLEQQNLPKNLVEIFCAELLCKVEENGKMEQFKEFMNICEEKGPSFCSQSVPVSKAPNLLEGFSFYIAGSHPTFEFGQEKISIKEVI